MPPVQNNSVVPKKQASKVWRYLGDNLDGAIAKCLLCTYNPTKGDAHKSSLVNRYSSSQVQPWSSRFAYYLHKHKSVSMVLKANFVIDVM